MNDTAPMDSAREEAPQEQSTVSEPTYNQEQPQQAHEPYRTPYQTPVRAEAGRPQYHAPESAQQPVNAPFTEGTHAYSTYQEWEAQNSRKGKKSRKPRSRKPLIAVLAVILVCAIFAGGVGVGGLITAASQSSAGAQVQQNKPETDENLPTLQVSATPSGTTTVQPGQVLNGEQVYEKCVPSMVTVQSSWISQNASGSGSGVVMTGDGYIITNAHVVLSENNSAQADKVSVVLYDGTTLPAQVIGADESTDLAVLKVNPTDSLVAAEFGNSDALKPGQTCYAIGSPGGLQLANTITTGSISAISRDITINDNVMSLIQIDAAINPGNSGGALINQYGQIVGITSAKLGISYYEGLGFAIPINSAKEIVDQLIQFGYIAGRPQVGISGYNIDETAAEYYNVPQGVMINSIDSRSNAAAAGMKRNDIIIAVNGQTITTMDEINEVKNELSAGDSITLTVHRLSTGEELDFTFALNDEHDFAGDDPALAQSNDQANNNAGNGGYPSGGSYYYNPFDYFFGR